MPKTNIGEKATSSPNGAGKTGHLHVRNEIDLYLIPHIQVSRKEGNYFIYTYMCVRVRMCVCVCV